jgi:hypothetical protein
LQEHAEQHTKAFLAAIQNPKEPLLLPTSTLWKNRQARRMQSFKYRKNLQIVNG